MTDEKTPVLIAVPMRVFGKADDLPIHLRELLGYLVSWQKDLPWSFEMMTFGGGNVSRGRNKIVAAFLRGNWKWLTFLDDDLFAEDGSVETLANQLIRVLAHKRHVCGALYTTKDEKRPHWVLNCYREPEIGDDGLLPVPELGTGGFKTYHRSVFEQLIRVEPGLAYICDESAAPEYGFFCQGLMTVDGRRRWLPEDYWLDQVCRKHGIPVMVDTTIRLMHKANDGRLFPLNGKWPRMPGPSKPIEPPDIAADMPLHAFPQKLLICLQYWGGDRDAAMRLARHIASLEDGFRNDVTLMFCHRHDCEPPGSDALERVAEKMPVAVFKCSEHETGYPASPNFMAMEIMRHVRTLADFNYNAALLMEADCVPVAHDWIDQLMGDWNRASAAGKYLMGSWRKECSDFGHVNGNMVFHPMITEWLQFPETLHEAWDIQLAPMFQGNWCRTGLIANRYMEIMVSPDELKTPECGSVSPVLIHGVKDESVWNSLTL